MGLVVTKVLVGVALLPMVFACGTESGSEGPNAGGSGGLAGMTPSGGAGSAGQGGSSGNGSGGTAGGAGAGIGGAGSAGVGGTSGSAGSAGATVLCDLAAPFGEPRPLNELNTTSPETGARLTSNELTIVFERDTVLYFARRASRNEPFGEPLPLGASVSSAGAPWISDDERVLLFESEGDVRITRNGSPGAFGNDTELAAGVTDPYVVGGANGRLYVEESSDLVVGVLTDWQPGVFEPVGVSGTRPVPTMDELALYHGGTGISVSTRASTSEAFGAPQSLEVTTPNGEPYPSWISPDRCRLYFDTFFDAYADIYVVERAP